MGINIASLVILAAQIMVLTLMPQVSITPNTALDLKLNGASDRAGDWARTGLTIETTTGAVATPMSSSRTRASPPCSTTAMSGMAGLYILVGASRYRLG